MARMIDRRPRPSIDAFTRAYIEAALWSSTDESSEPLDQSYGVSSISPKTLKKMSADCAKFQRENGNLIGLNEAQAGHDFWLTRNGHGAGFWDGDWPEPTATVLTKISKEFGEVHLYVGDDNKIHQM